MKFYSTKTFRNYPCSHRRWQHEGHCAHIHGYSRSFSFVFACSERTRNGFVMDFGGLKEVKRYLAETFDHTLLVDSSDPLLPRFRELETLGACKLKTYDDVGMEGTAQEVYKSVSDIVEQASNGRVWIKRLEVRENDKNSAFIEIDEKQVGRVIA